jgi:hypothetical protein
MVYSERLILFADILGWSAEIGRGQPEVLLAAIEEIQAYTQEHSQAAREAVLQAEKEGRGKVNPMYLEVQFGAFSDHFVFSMPASFGSRILSTASKLAICLLRKGFLTRGAIALGNLYHVDNAIFGPALLEAVTMEEEEAFYPRILVSGSAASHIAEEGSATGYDRMMITDQTGRLVVNPFPVMFGLTEDTERTRKIFRSFVELNFYFNEIKPRVYTQISEFEAAGRIGMQRSGDTSGRWLKGLYSRRLLSCCRTGRKFKPTATDMNKVLTLVACLLFAVLVVSGFGSNFEDTTRLLSAVSPIVTVCLALFALHVWRVQLVMRRRFEVAEEALTRCPASQWSGPTGLSSSR